MGSAEDLKQTNSSGQDENSHQAQSSCHLQQPHPDTCHTVSPDDPHILSGQTDLSDPPSYSARESILPLNIVIQVVGSRGDVQPFVALGRALQLFGHRVRIATHAQFQDFVKSSSLEFFDIGGDPADLMAFMVETPSMIPTLKQLRAGIVQRKRAMYKEMLSGFWKSCIEADSESKVPFVADAIIANPPSFAHVHCAQALGIPLHLMFTMPWTSTKEFAHPLANITAADLDSRKVNYASYAAIELLTWQGLGDLVNDWRVSSLGLEPVPGMEGHRLAEALEIPFTYCWSPSLVPKPSDWGSHINVGGFFFRDEPLYSPPMELETFLNSGPPPIYVGFGSIVASGSEGLLTTVLNAARAVRVRVVISKGWSNLGGENSPDVFFIGDCPHEWLFPRMAAVVHHGGAGTTACGLRYGKPTTIIPFFGDQPFWGNVVAKAGAGPEPIPYRFLTSQNLTQALEFCLTPGAVEAARRIADSIIREDGVTAAVQAFHTHLPLARMRCDFRPKFTASLCYGKGKRTVKMCKQAAAVLAKEQCLPVKHLDLYRTAPITIDSLRWDPLTALSAASLSAIFRIVGDTADIVIRPFKNHKTKTEGVAEELAPKRHSIAPSFAMLPLPESPESTQLAEAIARVPNTNQPLGSQRQAASLVLSDFGKLAGNATKGILIDIPLALTEGLRAVPRLYGTPMRKHDPVDDFQSGLVVAGKTFCEGMAGGVSDIFVHTYHGKKNEGAAGATKGLGKGVASFVTKTTSATLGLFSYPAQGLYRSAWAATHVEPRKIMIMAKLAEGDWLILEEPQWSSDRDALLQDFNGLRGQRTP
ncbi:unnamed protein product [Clonostachys byssicola]|uniref:Glycosyltransferase family 28 N-terminal domain-containing protein n=1 Tax=Clonostachys byssicola TaxID=160290 RepID=A0A9N9UF50_9HYPO|nr:unnamed protein product [Clonostachys byssicola]